LPENTSVICRFR